MEQMHRFSKELSGTLKATILNQTFTLGNNMWGFMIIVLAITLGLV